MITRDFFVLLERAPQGLDAYHVPTFVRFSSQNTSVWIDSGADQWLTFF